MSAFACVRLMYGIDVVAPKVVHKGDVISCDCDCGWDASGANFCGVCGKRIKRAARCSCEWGFDPYGGDRVSDANMESVPREVADGHGGTENRVAVGRTIFYSGNIMGGENWHKAVDVSPMTESEKKAVREALEELGFSCDPRMMLVFT